GFGWLAGWEPAFGILVDSPIRTLTNFNFSVVPMFLLMGSLVSASGMSRELFRAANAWVGHLRGGMAMGTVLACGGFAAINGSAVASAATMTTVALPEMRHAGYNPGFAAGVIAAGGTLGIMIPPSVMFILYGILTEQNVAELFIAGVMPGLLAMGLYCITIQLVYWVKRDWMPPGERADRKERMQSLRDVWATLLLFFLVFGGIYAGFVTIVEAAGLGVIGALVIGVLRGRLTRAMIIECLVESLRTSAAIFFILVTAFLFQYFLAVTQTSQLLGDLLTSLPFGPTGILITILAFYIIAGMFIDDLAVVLLTIPIVFPIVVELGFDPIWFGVIIVTTVEIGLIAPPVGIICFIMSNMVPDIGVVKIYRGVMPFILSDLVRMALLIMFPSIALWLVHTMG
ncbi:MAG TPA: TRAP transporter large permease, partial [Alphaproteobacteria bacterium]|nr:TRAP transporter large permease [Alphaproteobacteria bacterium]